jgi:hypothetical protein
LASVNKPPGEGQEWHTHAAMLNYGMVMPLVKLVASSQV